LTAWIHGTLVFHVTRDTLENKKFGAPSSFARAQCTHDRRLTVWVIITRSDFETKLILTRFRRRLCIGARLTRGGVVSWNELFDHCNARFCPTFNLCHRRVDECWQWNHEHSSSILFVLEGYTNIEILFSSTKLKKSIPFCLWIC